MMLVIASPRELSAPALQTVNVYDREDDAIGLARNRSRIVADFQSVE
jgi:hypothetical protein